MCSLCDDSRAKAEAARREADILSARGDLPDAVRMLREYAEMLDERIDEFLDRSFNDE